MALTALAIVFVLYYIYITEKVNYEKLSEEYNAMFHFIQTFEEWIDKEQLGMHEMKNTLSGIRGMTKDKKIINKIDGILKESMLIEKEWVEQLKDIPCGGIKGLFYYKLAIAKTKKVKLYVEVSPKVGKKIKSLQDEVIRKLCILLGIYLDNAIEAASDAKKKEVSLEVYLHKEDLTFVVSNTYQQKPDLTHLAKRGYTTKGPGHGRGLYFAAKTLNKSKVFKGEQQIIDDFFIQKLTVCVTK